MDSAQRHDTSPAGCKPSDWQGHRLHRDLAVSETRMITRQRLDEHTLPDHGFDDISVDTCQSLDPQPIQLARGLTHPLGEVGHPQPVRCTRNELAFHQIRGPHTILVLDRGAHRLTAQDAG